MLILFALPGLGGAITIRLDEPEDSPLFAASRRSAFAQFTSQDRLTLATQATAGRSEPRASPVIVVEGARWHSLGEVVSGGVGAARKEPIPQDVTTETTCQGMPTCPTMFAVSCQGTPSCVAGTCPPTTHAAPTCPPWCAMPTYAPPGAPTCNGTCTEPTCNPINSTCSFFCTTVAPPTCSPTCIPAQCPTALSGVSVPQIGVIQLTFNSSPLLQYTLQYNTNLNENEWQSATNARGNGSAMTFSCTNTANLAFYRLLISE